MNFSNKLLLRRVFGHNLLQKCTSKNSTSTVKLKSHEYLAVVGLEIHAQIETDSKLMSGAGTCFNAPVNENVALFDAAIPGTLPVLNRGCVEAAVKTALALKCCVNPVSMFERKHYFYADLPFGYQITQQSRPIAQDGEICFEVCTPKGNYSKSSALERLQLEQDSAKLLHATNKSLIDLNRAGIPLMELVFKPDLANGKEAAALVKELCLYLTTIRTSTCKMEEGALRVDANVSLHKYGEPLGVRTEIKNIGSIGGVADAIDFEIKRQKDLVDNNQKYCIVNETRAWNAEKKMTVSMREKETKYDYRFMLEPNLPPLHLHMPGTPKVIEDLVSVEAIKCQMPKLPNQMRMELIELYGLPPTSANILVHENVLYKHFMNIINNGDRKPSTVTNVLVMELLTILNKENIVLTEQTISSESLGDLVDMYADGLVNLVTVRKVLTEIFHGNKDEPRTIVEKNDWCQISDLEKIESMCVMVIEDNPKLVKQYKEGKKKVFKALLGSLATVSKNRLNMAKASSVLEKLLKA